MQNALIVVILFLLHGACNSDPLPIGDPPLADLEMTPPDLARPACRGQWVPADPHDPSNGCLGQEEFCHPCRDDSDCCGLGGGALPSECTAGGTLVTYGRTCDQHHQCAADFRGECKPPGG